MQKPKREMDSNKNKFFLINDGRKGLDNMDENLPTESERANTSEGKPSNSKEEENKANADAPFIMTIEVEEGRNDKIYIYFDSSAEELAFDFCKKNNLDFNSLKYLTDEIGKLIDRLHEKRTAEVIQEVDEEDKASEFNKSSHRDLNKSAVKDKISANQSIRGKKVGTENNTVLTEGNASKLLKESQQKKDNLAGFNNFVAVTNNSLASSNLSKEKISARNDEIVVLKENFLGTTNNIKEAVYKNINQTIEEKANDKSNHIEYLPTKELYENTAPNNTNNKMYEYQLYLKQIINKEARKKLGRNNNSSKDNIFTKLYNDSKYRKTKKLSMTDDVSSTIIGPTTHQRTVSNTRAKSPKLNLIINNNNNIYNTINKCSSPKQHKDLNYGEKLYLRGMALKEEKVRVNSQKRAEREKFSGCTFQPNIKSSDILQQSDASHRRYGSMTNNLITSNSRHRQSRNFSPSSVRKDDGYLNQFLTESNMAKTRDRNLEISELAKVRERLSNSKGRKIVKSPEQRIDSLVKKNNFITEDFIEKPQDYEKKKTEMYSKLKEQYGKQSNKSSKITPSNSKPTVSKEKFVNTNQHDNKDLYENLYSEAKFKKIINERNENLMALAFKKNSNQVHTTGSTNELYSKKKVEQFEKIFRLLDQDEDGVISSLNITVKNLPQQIVRIINPIIQLLKEDNIKLTLVEFVKECDYLFENLTYLEKKDLINLDKFYESYSFNHNNSNFIKKILSKKDVKANLSRQKTNSTLSCDKSINPSQMQNNLNTGSNEDLLNIYSNMKY